MFGRSTIVSWGNLFGLYETMLCVNFTTLDATEQHGLLIKTFEY